MNRDRLFTVLGVPFTVDANSWRFVPPKLLIGLLVSFIALPELPLLPRILTGLMFGVLLLLVLLLHIVGHIVTSKFVSPAMTEARITPILIETRYNNDPDDLPARVHLIRALGGPLLNLLLGGFILLIGRDTSSHAPWFFGVANIIIAIMVLLPFPSLDGGVIWREALRLVR